MTEWVGNHGTKIIVGTIVIGWATVYLLNGW
jgi:hypothetical protein